VPTRPRTISVAAASSGSATCKVWKRRVSAGSFSMWRLYSLQVVAPTVRNVPRASAGLSRLAASPVPACPPAPIKVCTSSTKRMTGCTELPASSSNDFKRDSNSPRMLAPANSAPTSRLRRRASRSVGGTLPLAMASARPSTTAVFPTPASPVSNGLFCRRRSRMSTMVRISCARPITGSISPARARAVRSVQYFCNADLPPEESAIAPVASPGIADGWPEPSCGPSRSSGEPTTSLAASSVNWSAGIF
jgi:hypothetical protein